MKTRCIQFALQRNEYSQFASWTANSTKSRIDDKKEWLWNAGTRMVLLIDTGLSDNLLEASSNDEGLELPVWYYPRFPKLRWYRKWTNKTKTHDCTELSIFFVTVAPGCFKGKLKAARLFKYMCLGLLGQRWPCRQAESSSHHTYMADAVGGASVGCTGGAAAAISPLLLPLLFRSIWVKGSIYYLCIQEEVWKLCSSKLIVLHH